MCCAACWSSCPALGRCPKSSSRAHDALAVPGSGLCASVMCSAQLSAADMRVAMQLADGDKDGVISLQVRP